MQPSGKKIKKELDAKVDLYNHPSFIKDDPVLIPHLFSKKQDIEIAGFFAAKFPGETVPPLSIKAGS